MTERICAIPDCGGSSHSRGWCKKHYTKWLRYGDPLAMPARGPRPGPLKPCAVEGCGEPHEAQGLCGTHYWRSRHGVPLEAPIQTKMRGATASERFWARVDRTGDCWLWMGSKNKHGYGTFVAEPPKRIGAHRFAYEEERGPIPVGMEIDHLCGNPSCVRPAHLEVVTHEENMRRRWRS